MQCEVNATIQYAPSWPKLESNSRTNTENPIRSGVIDASTTTESSPDLIDESSRIQSRPYSLQAHSHASNVDPEDNSRVHLSHAERRAEPSTSVDECDKCPNIAMHHNHAVVNHIPYVPKVHNQNCVIILIAQGRTERRDSRS